MAIQILAIRLVGDRALENITEVVWRRDETGEVHPADRDRFAAWMRKYPDQLVYIQDIGGKKVPIEVYEKDGRLYLRAVAEAGASLLDLPPYLTPSP
jgi:hypothetical protein